jgi:acyl dehydratase
MLTLETPEEFGKHIGLKLGPTEWRTISQTEISGFADLTGDDHWIHVDADRAAQETPGGRTIVHGLYMLSLIPKWQRQLFHIQRRGAGLLCGYDKVRFVLPVHVETPIRLHQVVSTVTPHAKGTKITLTNTIETQEPGRTALAAESILLIAGA